MTIATLRRHPSSMDPHWTALPQSQRLSVSGGIDCLLALTGRILPARKEYAESARRVLVRHRIDAYRSCAQDMDEGPRHAFKDPEGLGPSFAEEVAPA